MVANLDHAGIAAAQRFTRRNPCPICDGGSDDRRGQGYRCAGYLSSDGEYAHCTREDRAGDIQPSNATPPTYAHRLHGPCRCGVSHGDEQPHDERRPSTPKPRKEETPPRVCEYLPKTLPDGWQGAASYRYHDATGALAFVVLRYERPDPDGAAKPEKTFRQAHRVPGGWVMSMQGVTRVLYRLPDLLASPADVPVFVVEGEECVEALRAVGLVATTTSGGALNWDKTPGAAEALRGRQVIVLPDNDPPNEQRPTESYRGQRHAVMVARDLEGIAASVRVLELPGLPSRGDVADWLAAGGTREELVQMATRAPYGAEWAPAYEDAIEIQGDTADDQTTSDEEWDEPEPLPDDLPPVATLDGDMLPDALRGWVFDLAERADIPADYIGAPALLVACSLVGRRIGMHPKRRDDWQVVPNTFGGIVGGPGTMKTMVLGEVTAPLARLTHEAAEQFQQDAAMAEADKACAAAQKDALKSKMVAAAKTGDATALADLKAEYAAITVDEPTQRKYTVSDATVEKLGMLLQENPQGLLLFRDELTGWLKTLDRAGHEADRAFYLEGWNGTGSHEVERVGRGSLHIPALCVSVLGGIQPGPLASYIYEASQDGGAGNDGLLQRFQLLVWPDQPRTYTHVDRWPNTAAKNRAYGVLRGLASITSEDAGATTDDEYDPDAIPMKRFSEAGQDLFDEWYTALQTRIRSGDVTGPLAAHIAKYASLMPSLALVFHLIDLLDGRAAAEDGVSELAAAQAIAWCEYLETHARRLYASASNPDVERARVLLRHIMRGDVLDGCTVRDVYLHHWEKLSTADEAEAALRVLDEYGWARLEVRKGEAGRPAKVIRVHPCYRRENTDTR